MLSPSWTLSRALLHPHSRPLHEPSLERRNKSACESSNLSNLEGEAILRSDRSPAPPIAKRRSGDKETCYLPPKQIRSSSHRKVNRGRRDAVRIPTVSPAEAICVALLTCDYACGLTIRDIDLGTVHGKVVAYRNSGRARPSVGIPRIRDRTRHLQSPRCLTIR